MMPDQREQIAKRKILLTRTAGFIGCHLALKLLIKVYAIVNVNKSELI